MKNIILRYFTIHSKNVLERANFIAKKAKKGNIDIVHVFQALVEEKGSVGSNILHNVGITQINSKSLENKKDLDSLPFSPKTNKAIIDALRVAQEFQFPYVGTEHLLYAIIKNNDTKVSKILKEKKVEIKKIFDQLEQILSRFNEFTNDPVVVLSQPQVANKKDKKKKNDKDELEKQEFLQEIMGEVSEFFSSILEKKKKDEDSNFLNRSGPRPSFGVIMPKTYKTSQFLEHFARDLNKEVIEGKIDPVIGREKEMDDLVCILMRKYKNNPVLVGEPGVGKTAIVAGLARRIIEKEVPPALLGRKIMSLDLGLLVAGTSFRGEFEDRFKRVLEEAEKDPNIILFIDELHNLVGAGSAQGSLDAANIIKPPLARGNLRCIGATTIEEYHKYIEKDGALERRFQSIWVQEPGSKETEKILKGIKKYYENHHQLKISDKAILQSVRLSSRYITDRFLPDKALDLLDETAAYVIQDEFKKGTFGKLQKFQTQKEKLQKVKERMVQTNNLDIAVSLLKNEQELNEEIKQLERKVAQEREFLPVMDERDVAQVMARKLNLPVELMLENKNERLKRLPSTLKKSLKGQNEVIDKITNTLRRSFVGISDPERPATAFLFVGPTGVGKTYLAKLLAKEMFLKEDALIRVDMTEFGEKHTISRLLGSPPGYVGYGEKNTFTDRIRKNPYSLILFDEIEKAHPEVFNILLQVLEDGILTDGVGRKIDFKNTIIIFTSNLGNDAFLRQLMGFDEGKQSISTERKQRIKVKQKLGDFLKPEFINRLSDIVFFKPLSEESIKDIAKLEIKKLKKRLLETKKIKLNVDREVFGFLSSLSLNTKEGVRILRKQIRNKIEELIAKKILEGKLQSEGKIIFSVRKVKSAKTGKKVSKIVAKIEDVSVKEKKDQKNKDSKIWEESKVG